MSTDNWTNEQSRSQLPQLSVPFLGCPFLRLKPYSNPKISSRLRHLYMPLFPLETPSQWTAFSYKAQGKENLSENDAETSSCRGYLNYVETFAGEMLSGQSSFDMSSSSDDKLDPSWRKKVYRWD